MSSLTPFLDNASPLLGVGAFSLVIRVQDSLEYDNISRNTLLHTETFACEVTSCIPKETVSCAVKEPSFSYISSSILSSSFRWAPRYSLFQYSSPGLYFYSLFLVSNYPRLRLNSCFGQLLHQDVYLKLEDSFRNLLLLYVVRITQYPKPPFAVCIYLVQHENKETGGVGFLRVVPLEVVTERPIVLFHPEGLENGRK